MSERPTCINEGCDGKAHLIKYNKKTGKPNWRKYCGPCHGLMIAKRAGFDTVNDYNNYRLTKIAKENGFESLTAYKNHVLLQTAKANGFETITDYLNSKHPYRKYRKTYCENVDGRLGYKCTAKIVWNGQLDTDHVDGNPSNQAEENLQTLCKNCHSYKTMINEDYRSTGRTQYRREGVAVFC